MKPVDSGSITLEKAKADGTLNDRANGRRHLRPMSLFGDGGGGSGASSSLTSIGAPPPGLGRGNANRGKSQQLPRCPRVSISGEEGVSEVAGDASADHGVR